MNELLCEIDTKLAKLARKKLDSLRFGAKVHVSMEDHKLLARYRDIVYDKANNDCCLKDFLVDDIISRVKQLLNRN
jgi:hypothetical protein